MGDPKIKKKWEEEMEEIKKWKKNGCKGEKPKISEIRFEEKEVIIESKIVPTPKEVIELMHECLTGGAYDSAAAAAKIAKKENPDKIVPQAEIEQALEDFMETLTEFKADCTFEKHSKRLVRKGNEKKTAEYRDLTVADVFNFFDLNKNGKVTISEFIQGCQTMGAQQDEKMLQQIFLLVDKQNETQHGMRRDGGMDWQEFRNALYSTDAGRPLAPKTWVPPS